ncbi:MAG TPA: ABC transporter permease [Gammaproteobacteria bacterium]|nr:ABC transporter permease [Gammaproteobacteria bacterium]
MLANLINDLRYAARRLSDSPGFTAAAVATIAIGVGINTAIFSVLNGFALRELPAPDADELVSVYQTLEGAGRRGGGSGYFSVAEYEAYRDGAETLSGLVAYSRSMTATLAGESPQEISGALVSCNYFDVLRQPPALGGGFGPDDCASSGAAPTVVLGHGLWTSAFGADPAIVGSEVVLNRHSFTVVGVAAEGMRGVDFEAASYFATFASQPLLADSYLFGATEARWLTLVGRRAPSATLEQVRAELRVIAARIDQEQPPRKTTLIVERAQVLSRPGARDDVFTVAGVVMAAFGMVLLIACANVANLLLARATRRSGEIAVRLSLGASRARIVQQLLAEAVLLAAAGGALGSTFALWSSQGLVTFAQSGLPGTSLMMIDTAPDGRVLAYAFLVTLATGLLFGLLPALRASKRDLHTAMKGASTVGQRSEGRLQGALIGAQVALSMVLMIAAALLLRGLYEAQTVEPGFRYQGVAVASFDLTRGGYDEARAAVFQRQLVERVGALPGVDAVAQAQWAPLTGNFEILAALPGEAQPFPLGFNNVSADYFSLLEIPIVRGRAFTAGDETDESTAAIVTETAARRLWPDRDPIGQKLTIGMAPSQVEVDVVGVARDAQVTEIGDLAPSYVYLPAAPRTQRVLTLLVRSGDFAAAAAAVRAVIAELDPGLVVHVAPLEANLEATRSLARVVSALATSLGAVALVLAAVGIYGVVAYSVGRRVREIGVRIALGAATRDVVALVLKQQMRPVAIGAAIGLAAALAVSRILSSVLFGVSPTDGVALLAAVLVVVGVGLAAGILPARRASRVDPNVVLHYE